MSIRMKLFLPSIILTCVFIITLAFLYAAGSGATHEISLKIRSSSDNSTEVYRNTVENLMRFIRSISFDPMLGPEPDALLFFPLLFLRMKN